MEFSCGYIRPSAWADFAGGDYRVFAGALNALREQGVDGFVVAYLSGCAWSRVLGEHEVFSFLAGIGRVAVRYCRVILCTREVYPLKRLAHHTW